MSNFVHDWILEKVYYESESTFTPNGDTASNGMPVGTIKNIVRKFAVGKKVATYAGETFSGGGGATIDVFGNLQITTAGGTTATIPKLGAITGTPDLTTNGAFGVDPSGTSAPPGAPVDLTGFGIKELTTDGIADMVLGLYNFTCVWQSTKTDRYVGAFAG